ncbi:MAG TPA: hypothetical protein DIC18_01825 [Clostridiales bacterium]|nr:hypothetical protein [Clostridiales bacterium]
MTDVTLLIDELEKELLGKKNLFGKCYVDEVKVTALLSRMRESIPQSIYEAQSLLRQKDAVLSDAERRADMIIRNANETKEKMLNESEVLAIAKKQAEEKERAMQSYCDNMRLSVHQKLDNDLYDIAVKLNEAMMNIEGLREEIWKRSNGVNNDQK